MASSKIFNFTSSLFFVSRTRNITTTIPCSYQHRLSAIQSYATNSVVEVENPLPPTSSHPWPEWDKFVEKLKVKGYFKLANSKADDHDEGADEELSVNQTKNACLMFARERYDILSSLPKESIQSIVEYGCPNLFRKAVNSAKRLRQYLQFEEADACSACCLKGSCDKAYVIPVDGPVARTVDLVRILLSYAVNAENRSGEANSSLSEHAQESARSLLTEIIRLSDAAIDPSCPKPVLVVPAKKEPSTKVVGKERQSSNIEMKKGDWLCPNCNFLNFARNLRCLECRHDGPKSVEASQPEMKPGDWTCPSCQFMNFARNKLCRRCRIDRPKKVLNPGEWECHRCDYLNFKGNVKCRKCNTKRRESEANQYEDNIWRKPKSNIGFQFDGSDDDNENLKLDDDSDGENLNEDEYNDDDDVLPPFKENKYVVSKRATPAERRLTSARKGSNFSNLVSRTE